jgi:hypothetical protein
MYLLDLFGATKTNFKRYSHPLILYPLVQKNRPKPFFGVGSRLGAPNFNIFSAAKFSTSLLCYSTVGTKYNT